MGLDGVELVITLEKRFDIDISDADAQQMRTVGDVYMYLRGRLREKEAHATPAEKQKTFVEVQEKIRRFFKEENGMALENLCDDTPLQTLFPWKSRKKSWARFKTATSTPLPKLHAPESVGWGVLGFCVLCGILLYQASERLLSFVSVWLLFTGIGLSIAASVCARSFPYGWNTLSDLEKYAWKFKNDDLWPALQEIIVEQLDVNVEQVTREARLVKDLGMD
ncbi:TPA: hypothetical protein DDW35_02980 [Candidatus Sumerlaeota bacterium]|jgi:acyl carrier protein|nr:hypothetical protein [Candidatus Sumerlaeota bacterium]